MMSALGISLTLMTSLVPLFLAPVGIAYASFVLSEFVDSDIEGERCRRTMMAIMDRLSESMLYTSLIMAVGFFSLGQFSAIARVRSLGFSMAFGIVITWFCTISFVPAYAMLLQRCLPACSRTPTIRMAGTLSFSRYLVRMIRRKSRYVLLSIAALMGIAIYGMTQSSFNDNPAQWFAATHPMGKAQAALNRGFSGVYQAYLVFEDRAGDKLDPLYLDGLREALLAKGEDLRQQHPQVMSLVAAMEKTMLEQADKELLKVDFLEKLSTMAKDEFLQVQGVDATVWRELMDFGLQKRSELDLFKDPALLRYIAGLQDHLLAQGLIAKSHSLADIVKDVHQMLLEGRAMDRAIPETSVGVGHCLSQLQSSVAPHDLWHFVTRDFKKTAVRFQLKNGGSADIERLQKACQSYTNSHPTDMEINWAGLPYIDSAWQKRVLQSMPKALAGSLIAMFLATALLFRSLRWGLLGTTALCLPTAVVYGAVGLLDSRFLPLLVSSLLPLQTAGCLLAAVAVLSGLTALIVLPTVVTALQHTPFAPKPLRRVPRPD
jgi:uncharacterized protein